MWLIVYCVSTSWYRELVCSAFVALPGHVSMNKKYHSDIPQANTGNIEEETQNTDTQ